ncbi:MAG: hypothetical protein JRJ29_12105 [Deltaproteobacteria bacterium]|nr:hypothetical protein [Deltaproteobacteria bacterium]
MKKISPLSLTSPEDPNFSPRGCRTFHDIMRFVHEKAFQELLKIGQNPRSLLRRGGKRLKANIPLDLILIDIGGGISPAADKDLYIEPEQITSLPMKAIWEGLSSRDTWNMQPVSVDFKGLMSSLTRTQSEEVMGNNLPNVNIGVIGHNYVHLSLPLGYHFTAVESAIAASPEGCFISFRFAGGVTDIVRRSRRAVFLANILETLDFKVETKGDLVVARAVQLTEEQTLKNLRIIGKLIGFTRQLDVLLKAEEDIGHYVKEFVDQIKMAS